MRFAELFGPITVELTAIVLAFLIPSTQGALPVAVPSPALDLSLLKQVVLTGDFDAISLYNYEGQNENSFINNGSQSLLTQYPNGIIQPILASDGFITSMCPFVRGDGTFQGVVLGGNFTMIMGVEAQGVVLYNPNTQRITPLPGLSGYVNALWCDQATDRIYVGGEFTGANSTNAMVWIGHGEWNNLPFGGFNGPVNSIIRGPDNLVWFGGSFSGVANGVIPTLGDEQVINLSTANISSTGAADMEGFNDPRNIVCKTEGRDGPGDTWLLQDRSPGSWKAQMNFGYEPTKLRLYNTHQDGRGAKTFRYTAFPINGIMNLTYTDPSTGLNATCDARCPLSNNSSMEYQDFHFVNVIGMNGFQIDISDWYGSGGGLNGIELFQNDIFAYADPSLNEPACSSAEYPSNATGTGPWTVTPSGQSIAQYLTASLTGPNVNSSSASVTFLPDVKQSGNYSVRIYTPGCRQDNTCGTRGIANVTGSFAAGQPPVTVQVYQSNYFEKYDQIYSGPVDANNADFRPSVTLTPQSGQNSSISLVALRVRFQLLNGSNEDTSLNGLFEYDPTKYTQGTNHSKLPLDNAGATLNAGAQINTIAHVGSYGYIGGNFTNKDFSNLFTLASDPTGIANATALARGGLNGPVTALYDYGQLLFVGGSFTDTVSGSTPGAKGVVSYDTNAKTWQSLGGGVNGRVNYLVPIELNITAGRPESCMSVNGDFTEAYASPTSKGFNVTEGFAIWVPSRKDWLANLELNTITIAGQLTHAVNLTDGSTLLSGTVSSQGMAADDAVALLSSSGNASIVPIGIQSSARSVRSSSRRKQVTGLLQNINGATTALFVTDNNRNITVVAGHFSALASDGSTVQNLAFINSTTTGTPTLSGVTTGIDAGTTFMALAQSADTLYAGGIVKGTVNGRDLDGLVLWDLGRSNYAAVQPPALGGNNVSVNAIVQRPNTADIYVGGEFDMAGQLGCPAICVYTKGQWQKPGAGFSGKVSTMSWQGNNNLLVGGNLTVGGNSSGLAVYDASSMAWSTPSGYAAVPGPVTAVAHASDDHLQYWAVGTATNGSAFLIKYDGSNFQTVTPTFAPETVIRGVSMLPLASGSGHEGTALVPAGFVVMITGRLILSNFGNVSAVLFNGTTFSPFILSTMDNGPGTLSQLVSEKEVSFSSGGGHLALGLVVLIGLAIALALIFLIVLVGLLLERYRRKREGYRPAPTNYFEKTANMGRIPPDQLFGALGRPSDTPRL